MSVGANRVLSGARGARTSWLRRVVSRATAGELSAFVVPGPEVARTYGLSIEAVGLRLSTTPRHANVLLVVGELPEGLRNAAAIAYAQMPRPRAVLAVGAEDVSPLPGPDVSVGMDAESIASGVAELRRIFEAGSFGSESVDFEAAALSSSTEYTCSMHPEVVQNEPSTCPKCGMDLTPREAKVDNEDDGAEDAHEDHDHDGDAEDSSEGVGEQEDHNAHHGAENEHGEGNEHSGEDAADEESKSESDESTHDEEHAGHDEMDHGDMDFMSMVEMTQGTPRGSDGLQMEWVEAPFGPLFPGLPGGLSLTLTLDGDTVAEAEAGSAVSSPLSELSGPVGVFCEKLAMMDRLSPISYRLLALRAIEDAAGADVDEVVTLARIQALERERAASHLNWLASFGYLLGYTWLARHSEKLLFSLPRAESDFEDIQSAAQRLAHRVERTPLLRRKLAGIGKLPDSGETIGPVARACGLLTDTRMNEEPYSSLGFEPIVVDGGDALARLRVRMAEVEQSLGLASAPDEVDVLSADLRDGVSGRGTGRVETPRGTAKLTVTLESGEVTAIELETPSEGNIGLVSAVTEQREVADALVGVASLDLSPWEIGEGGAE